MSSDSPWLLSYYGDDFTGSTDVMEALETRGVPTALFLRVPSETLLSERFPHIRAFGVAGVSRSMSEAELETELAPLLEQLALLGAPIVHYKLCSTFDSSPDSGSIGKVMEIARRLFPGAPAFPLLAACPPLKRYTVFGHHFAGADGTTYRLDRHPTMARHPVTPMDEADLREHLKRQTSLTVGLMDVLALDREPELRDARYRELAAKHDAVLLDALTDQHLDSAGALIDQATAAGQSFVLGSSGVEYGLAAQWQRQGRVSGSGAAKTALPVDQLLVLSGSCSPATEAQLRYAFDHGYAGLQLATDQLLQDPEATMEDLFEQALAILQQGRSLVIYSAIGPEDPAITATRELLMQSKAPSLDTGRLLGSRLGQLGRRLLEATGLRRLAVAGGDTSGYVTGELGIYALEMLAPLVPGCPLCRCSSDQPDFDGLEIVLKGGQIGEADFLERIRIGS
ncbi:four-carbon acid sugar kinase family protein [Paenibacillus daejeonensis]|uniref:four-carbon acid sugar kinase family protein n=1 Tax=Paenibacillus daejeonensis TaxID=135193 RepID=UPI0003625823|nr:four-carbon acid sugar kinase family protein [Paenibacillus daejeonensis]